MSVRTLNTAPTVNYEYNTGEYNANFRVTKFFINNSEHTITAVLRNNLPVTTERMALGYATNRFISRTVYHFNTKECMHRTINDIHTAKQLINIERTELDLISEVLTRSINTNRDIGSASVVVDRVIAMEDLLESPIYYSDMDLLIYPGVYNSYLPHPQSEEGLNNRQHKNIIETRQAAGVFLELVDNENNISTRYMYAAQSLIQMYPTPDASRKSGVYFTSIEKDKAGKANVKASYYDFDTAETAIGLHKTKEAAITGGSPELIVKSENQKREQELLETKAELERLRNKFKMEELERQQEIARLTDEAKAKNIKLEYDLLEEKKLNEQLSSQLERQKIERAERKRESEIQLDMQRREQEALQREVEIQHAIIKRELELKHEALKRERENQHEDVKMTREWVKFIPAILTGIFAIAAVFFKMK